MSTFPTLLLCFTFIILSILAQDTVPPSKTFKFVNEGAYGQYTTEYGSNYRLLADIQTPIFSLGFYNTTPSEYTLGLLMGGRPEYYNFNIMKWVWDANRGNLVGEKATLTFGSNGNLVLAHANGNVAWQTGTENQGVVGIELLPNGNLVLVDSHGRFIWQSFDYPTDSLLVGQGILLGGTTKLFSRVSAKDGSKGAYSFVFEKNTLALYLKSKNSPNPIRYYASDPYFPDRTINQVVFTSELQSKGASVYDLSCEVFMDNSTSFLPLVLASPKYNSTLSLLRLESDGNLRIYTYFEKATYGSWDVTYAMFDRAETSFSECKLPTKCRSLGICMNHQCVGCPTPKGLSWWNESCAPPKLPLCNKGVSVNAKYYKVDGVEHFTGDEGEVLKVTECREKCTADCGCLGFFYREELSRCLLAYELGPLSKVSTLSHFAYIKM